MKKRLKNKKNKMGGKAPGQGYEIPPTYFPPFDGPAGSGFARFIHLRWPRSLVLPRGIEESEASWLTRDEQAEKDYDVWIRDSFSIFIRQPENFVLPYGTLLVVGRPALYNFPPNSARLRHPENTTGIFASREGYFRRHFDPGAITSKDFDWVDRWNEVENLYPYNPTKDRNNFMLQPVEQNPGDADLEEIRETWTNWFRETWPLPRQQIGYFNQTDPEIAVYFEGIGEAYESWVQENFTKFWERDPNLKDYWTWPLPYDVEPFSGIVVNKPPYQCQLAYGLRRTQTIIGLTPNKPDYPLGDSAYRDLWITMFANLNIGSMNIFLDASYDVERLSGDTNRTRVGDHVFENVENYTWGPGGRVGRRYPNSFPPRYLADHGSELLNYGLFTDWCDPYDLVSDIVLVESTLMPFPPDILLQYWDDLINTFQEKNPRLYVPRYTMFATPGEKINYDTDRIGYKMFPESSNSYFSFNTSEMGRIDETYFNHLQSFDQYLFSFTEGILNNYAIFKNPTFTIVPQYRTWSRAVLQAIHFRYAERHHFHPWESFQSLDSTRTNEFPKKDALDLRAKESLFDWDWPVWLWADNFSTWEQDNAKKKLTTPYDFPPFRSDILPWTDLLYLLKTVQERRTRGDTSSTILDIRLFDQGALDRFGLFIWNYRRKNTLDMKYLSVTGYLRSFLMSECLLNNTRSYDYWKCALSYLLQNMFDSIIHSSSKVELKKLGECIVNPENITQDCALYVTPTEPDESPDLGIDGDLQTVANFWHQQWLQTSGLQSWPKYALYEDGTVHMLDPSQPVPGFWEKWWNTLFGSAKYPPGWGYEVGTEKFEVISGFILPPSPKGRNYSSLINRIYAYLKLYPMPIIRVMPPGMQPVDWSRRIQDQWASYWEWIQYNIKAEKSPLYRLPNNYLVDLEGNELFDRDGQKLINCFPSFGVFPINSQTDFAWIWRPGEWIETAFGQAGLLALLESAAKAIAKSVVSILRILAEAVGSLFDLWKVLLIGGGIVTGYVVLNKVIDRSYRDPVDHLALINTAQSHKRKRMENALLGS